jgi:predicted nucleic acid-binding protein
MVAVVEIEASLKGQVHLGFSHIRRTSAIGILSVPGRELEQGYRRDLALIAATALEHNLTLVTTNAWHFPVAGLRVQEFPQL